MSKKLIILTAIAGFVSFAGAFVFALFTKPTAANDRIELNPPGFTGQQTGITPPQPDVAAEVIPEGGYPAHRRAGDKLVPDETGGTLKHSLTDKQLRNLIYEALEKKRQYENKLQSLQTQEKRVQIAQDTLKKDIENLNNLQIELASVVANLKEQRDKLLASRIEIDRAEKGNLAKIAATYDKMDAASAGNILINMCQNQAQNTDAVSGKSNINDAVKILYYMGERAKAKVLAELANTEPKLAAALCERLKQINEEK